MERLVNFLISFDEKNCCRKRFLTIKTVLKSIDLFALMHLVANKPLNRSEAQL